MDRADGIQTEDIEKVLKEKVMMRSTRRRSLNNGMFANCCFKAMPTNAEFTAIWRYGRLC